MLTPDGSSLAKKINFKHAEAIPSPFLDYSSLFLPTNLNEAFSVAETMYYSNATFKQAVEYSVSYFTGTDLNITTKDEDKANEYKKYLIEKQHIKKELFLIGRDLKVYGNTFVSVIAPFERFLICDKCRHVAPIKELEYEFKLSSGFTFQCKKCGKQAAAKDPIDRATQEENKIVIKHWPLRYMRIEYQPYGKDHDYFLQVPPLETKMISEGNKKYISEVPWGIITSVRNNKLFKFNDNMIHHVSLENISDVMLGPWGLPPVIAAFRDAYLVQLLRKANATIALDHMLPTRLITPQSIGGAQDNMKVNLGNFGSQVMQSINRSRQDATGYMWLPMPVNYELIGGDGQKYATPELLEQSQAEFLNGLGIPIEMYKKNLSMEAAPFAARLFEAGETIFLSKIQTCLSWIIDRISAILSWLPCETTLVRPTHADDIERRMIMLQMMMQGIAAEQDVLSLFDLDWKTTFNKRQAEQEYKMKQEKEYMDKMQKMQQNQQIIESPTPAGIAAPGQVAPGAMGPNGGVIGDGSQGGAPPMPINGIGGGPSGGSRDVDSMMADAQARATQIMQQAPLGSPARRQMLAQIRQSDPNIYPIVKDMLDQATAQAESQGRDQLRGQEQMGNSPSPPM